MAVLRDAALEAGERTVFSATEAAGGIEALAKAGVSTADIVGGGLTGALDLAAAGGLDVASAAEIAATALTQFKLRGQDVSHVADLLAAGAGKAQGDVSDLSMALKQSGLVAAQMGLSIEETTGTLAAFASAGLLGSDAGTSLRTMLLRLANPAGEASDLMESLGIHAYDATGGFVGVESLAGQLQTRLGGLTQAQRDSALATIFGSDAIRAANVLYSEGAQGVRDWTTAVDDQGFAAETAAIKLDNLKGDLEAFFGSLETALIGAGEGADGPLRQLVQTATDLVNRFNELPDPVKQATVLIAGAGGLGLLGAAAMIKLVTSVAAARTAMSQLGISTLGVAKNFGLVGLAVGEVIVATNTLKADIDILSDSQRSWGEKTLDFLKEQLKDESFGLIDITDKSKDAKDATDDLSAATDQAAEAWKLHQEQLAANTEQTDAMTQAVVDLAEEQRKITDPIFAMISAVDDVAAAQAAYNDAVDEYGKKSPEASAAAVDLAEKMAALEQAALDDDLSFADFETKLDSWVATGRITEGQAELIRQRVKGARGEAEAFDKAYTPEIHVKAFGLLSTLEQITELKRQLDLVDDRHVAFEVDGRVFGTGRTARQHGGDVSAHEMFTVGEAGRELFVPGVSGHVLAHSTAERLLREAMSVRSIGTGVIRSGTASGGMFTGELYLDSGAFLGTVRGEVRSEISGHDRALRRRATSRSGTR